MSTETLEPAMASAGVNARRRERAVTAAIAGFYAIFVLFMWAPFGLRNGMPSETFFPYMSETRSWYQGFTYPYDPLRVYCTFFFHVAYLLGELLGIRGNYVSYQITYVLLWWTRGMIVYLTARRLWPQFPLFNFLLGAILIFHASDRGLNWVGMLNQMGVMVWMFASFYFLVRACQAKSWAAAGWIVLACLMNYMSLWSYESGLFLLALAPVLLLFRFGWRAKNLATAAAYWIVPAVYAYLNYMRYRTPGKTFQETRLRADFSPSVLTRDFLFNLQATFKFWDWGPRSPVVIHPARAMGLGIAAAATLTLGLWVVHRLTTKDRDEPLVPKPKLASALLAAGLALVIFSFPAYLLLRAAGTLWRTQFFSGLGAALVLVAAAALLAAPVKSRRWAATMMLLIALPWTYFGTYAAYEMGDWNFDNWNPQQKVVASILRLAPSVKDGTVIVLTNVPRPADPNHDPFYDVMYFDLAMRLAYPGKNIDAVYYYPDGTLCPSGDLHVEGAAWKWHNNGWQPMMPDAEFANTLVLKLVNGDHVVVSETVPPYVTTNPAALRLYDPRKVLLSEPASPIAVQRYLRGHPVVVEAP